MNNNSDEANEKRTRKIKGGNGKDKNEKQKNNERRGKIKEEYKLIERG